MTRQDFAVVAVRTLGLLCFVLAVRDLEPAGRWISLAMDSSGRGSQFLNLGMIWSSVSLVVLMGAGLILLARAPRIARFLVKPGASHVESQVSRLADIQSVAFSAVGVLMAGLAVPRIAEAAWLLHGYLSEGTAGTSTQVFRVTAPQLASGVLQLLLGILVFVGAPTLTRFAIWLRRLGMNREQDS